MQKFGGISRYFFEIFSRVSVKETAVMDPMYNQNAYFNTVLNGKNDLCQGRKFPGKFHLRNMLEEVHLRSLVRRGTFDIIHHTGEFPLIYFHRRSVPVVVTVHDMIPEENNDKRRVWQRRMCVKMADHIICVSEFTRQSMLKWYPELDEKKISVIYHGFSFPGCCAGRIIEDEYLLFVGSRGGYKNFEIALEAIADILKERNMKLVCAGNAFSAEEKDKISRLGLSGSVIEFGFADDMELNSLYRHASLFIFPSKLEGFGIPILEAMSLNCPICLSDASCFPEIAQDAADYFDPDNKDSIAASVKRVLEDCEYREKLIQKGAERAAEFSWEKAAAETLAVYKNVLGGHKNQTL